MPDGSEENNNLLKKFMNRMQFFASRKKCNKNKSFKNLWQGVLLEFKGKVGQGTSAG